MSYNIEEQEDYLKNNSPYEKDEAQWDAMQQRIRAAVLAAARQETPPKKRLPFWKLTVAAALLCALLPVGFALFTRQDAVVAPGDLTLNKTVKSAQTAEQMLDNTIGELNDAELNWLRQLNENELTEPNEYSEN